MTTSSNPPHYIVCSDTESGDATLLQWVLKKFSPTAQVEMHTPESVLRALNQQALSYNAIFFVLNDERFYTSFNRTVDRLLPCPTIATIWHILDSHHSIPIHVAVPQQKLEQRLDTRLTALDILALGLSGVTGIGEISTRLIDAGNWIHHLQQVTNRRRQTGLYLFGRPAEILCDFYREVTSPWWPTTANSDGRSFETLGRSYVKYGFRLLVALATLEEEDLQLESSSRIITITNLAEHLAASDQAGLYIGPEIVAKAFGPIVDAWIEQGRLERRDRYRMPSLARQDGFPNTLPLLRGSPRREVAERLYEALWGLEVERIWEEERPTDGWPIDTVVYLPSQIADTRRIAR